MLGVDIVDFDLLLASAKVTSFGGKSKSNTERHTKSYRRRSLGFNVLSRRLLAIWHCHVVAVALQTDMVGPLVPRIQASNVCQVAKDLLSKGSGSGTGNGEALLMLWNRTRVLCILLLVFLCMPSGCPSYSYKELSSILVFSSRLTIFHACTAICFRDAVGRYEPSLWIL